MQLLICATWQVYLFATFIGQSCSHSWVEQMQVISSNGSFMGDYGYSRGYVARTEAEFNGDSVDYLLPALDTGRTRINSSDLLCHPAQRTSNYSTAHPRLDVNAGSHVAMKYLENGHVTQPQNQLGKPPAAGTVFIYGTTSPTDDEKIADVLQWTTDGSGGNGQGSLLTAQSFDDGRCHQISAAALSVQRQQEFPDRVPDQPTSNVEQWCETDLKIPSTQQAGSTLTLYWVWQWPTAPGVDPNDLSGKDEYYTTCADVNVVAAAIEDSAPVHTLVQQDPQSTADSAFLSRTALTTFPSVTLAGATGALTSSTRSSSPATPTTGHASSTSQGQARVQLLTTTTASPSPPASAEATATVYITATTEFVTVTAGAPLPTIIAPSTVTDFVTTLITATLQSAPSAAVVQADGLVAEKRYGKRSFGLAHGARFRYYRGRVVQEEAEFRP